MISARVAPLSQYRLPFVRILAIALLPKRPGVRAESSLVGPLATELSHRAGETSGFASPPRDGFAVELAVRFQSSVVQAECLTKLDRCSNAPRPRWVGVWWPQREEERV